MTPMAYIMNLVKDGESYTIVIPASEYLQIGKDPSIIAKYWEQLSKERQKNKEELVTPGTAESQLSSKDGDQQLPSDKKGISSGRKPWKIPSLPDILSLEIGSISNKWTFLAIRRLIRCRKHGKFRFQQTDINKEGNDLWEFVSHKMNKSGHTFSSQECETKWLKLLAAYERLKNDKDGKKLTLKEWKIFSMIEDAFKKSSKLKKRSAKEVSFQDTSLDHNELESSATKYSISNDPANNNLVIIKENFDADKSFSSQSGSSISDTSSYHCHCCVNSVTEFSESTPPPWFMNFQKSVNAKFENFRNFLTKETVEFKELVPLLKECVKREKRNFGENFEKGLLNQLQIC